MIGLDRIEGRYRFWSRPFFSEDVYRLSPRDLSFFHHYLKGAAEPCCHFHVSVPAGGIDPLFHGVVNRVSHTVEYLGLKRWDSVPRYHFAEQVNDGTPRMTILKGCEIVGQVFSKVPFS